MPWGRCLTLAKLDAELTHATERFEKCHMARSVELVLLLKCARCGPQRPWASLWSSADTSSTAECRGHAAQLELVASLPPKDPAVCALAFACLQQAVHHQQSCQHCTHHSLWQSSPCHLTPDQTVSRLCSEAARLQTQRMSLSLHIPVNHGQPPEMRTQEPAAFYGQHSHTCPDSRLHKRRQQHKSQLQACGSCIAPHKLALIRALLHEVARWQP